MSDKYIVMFEGDAEEKHITAAKQVIPPLHPFLFPFSSLSSSLSEFSINRTGGRYKDPSNLFAPPHLLTLSRFISLPP